jgi:hypothetical protein
VHETQVPRDERNEYFGITLERAAKILGAQRAAANPGGDRTVAAFSRRTSIMTANSQHEQTFPRKRTLTTILDICSKRLIYNWMVGRPGLEPGTKALKGFYQRPMLSLRVS